MNFGNAANFSVFGMKYKHSERKWIYAPLFVACLRAPERLFVNLAVLFVKSGSLFVSLAVLFVKSRSLFVSLAVLLVSFGIA
ncbi:hypothetical protein GW626_20895 [Peribacillus muralis]|uniref:hypothetical protein n=1 Tax=Peribacillus muralis TaxID=264697 RepID=UPI001F4DCDC2|nr:hypothetical protein [Peribacillus muralis]MCK1994341.1 hypothetical protein [Peribacillus muralis]MCK2014874.1 hypothetical protein [Peribacillus muralis]